MKTFETIEELAASGYLFRIQDNGGASGDRYTVAFCDGHYLAMSGNPTLPWGISQSDEDLDLQVMREWQESGEGVDMSLGDLPPHIAQHLLHRINEAWSNWLEAIDGGRVYAVASSRAAAVANEGTAESAGKGIYRGEEGLMVRLDGAEADDLGPYATAAAVMVATLPQDYGLSGPEYHSSVQVSSLEASPEVAAAIAALEAKVDSTSSPSP